MADLMYYTMLSDLTIGRVVVPVVG